MSLGKRYVQKKPGLGDDDFTEAPLGLKPLTAYGMNARHVSNNSKPQRMVKEDADEEDLRLN